MRKRKLIEQNEALFSKCETLQKEISELKKKLCEAERVIAEQEQSKENGEANETVTPLEKIEVAVSEQANEQSAAEYGAKAIGKIVLEAAKQSDSIKKTDLPDKSSAVNLILGKAEVSKAEILETAAGEGNFAEKKAKIDGIVENARKYFNSFGV